MNKRIVLTGGGTGGHVYPLLAVLEELHNLAEGRVFSLRVWYLGPKSDYEEEFLAWGVKIKRIASSKWRRYASAANLLDLLIKLPFSLVQALWELFWIMPDAVFSKGGPGALPVVLAARFYRLPVFIHESDSVPGLTNLVSGRFAKKIGISFESAEKYFAKKEKLILVGNPIRPALLRDQPDPVRSKRRFNFNPNEKIVLVIGGSQGSVRINEFILDNLKSFLALSQILHQVGAANFEQVKSKAESILREEEELQTIRYHPVDYLDLDWLKDAFTAADLVISRAGGGAIFEIAAFGKPSILIPLPEAASEHQKINAYEYAKTGAALIVEEPNLLGTVFLNQLKNVLSSPERMAIMSQAAKNFARPAAARKIAEELLLLG